MKKWMSRLAKAAVLLSLLAMFSTLTFAAMTEVEVTAVKLESGVEVMWSDLSQYEGMDVWCAAYDADGKMLAVKQTDMIEGRAIRIDCDPRAVASVKLFILDEQLQPAQDAKMPEHIHIWEAVDVAEEPTFLEAGVGQCVCVCGETGETVAIPPASTPEERALVARAEEAGLLQYLVIDDLDNLTRLEVAGLVAAYTDWDVDNTDECTFSDCAELSSMEKRIINAAIESDTMRGSGDGNFRPHASITRSEFILVLMNCVGNPECSWDKTCTNVPEWNEYDANTLYNLGILGDDPDLRGDDYATRADALEWLLNAREWENTLPEIVKPSNLRFEVDGKWLRWDIEETNLTNLRYMVSLWDDENGKWLPNWGVPVREGTLQGLCTRWTEEGSYTGIRVVPRLDRENLWDGSIEVGDMSVTVTRNEQHGAVVELVKENDQPKALSVSGLTAGETVRVSVRDDEGIYNDAVEATVNADGTLYQEIDVDWDGPIYYAIEKFGGYTLSADGKSLSYTVTCYGEGVVGALAGFPEVSDPALEITNPRFEMGAGAPRIVFDAPAGATGDETYLFYIREDGGEWYDRQWTDSTRLFIGSYAPEVDYEMLVATQVNDEIVAWKMLDLELNIRQGAPGTASAVFEETSANGAKAYLCTVTGGTPNANFILYVWEEGQGSAAPGGVLSANGDWSSTEGGNHTMSHIENGMYMVREFEDLVISADGKTCSFVARDTEDRVCNPVRFEMDPAYAAENLHFEQNSAGMLFLAWDAPAAAAGQNVEYAFQFYRVGDNSPNDWSGQTDSAQLGLWKFGNTNYDRLHVQTIVDGVPKGEVMFERNFLTITEGVDPNVQLTYTMIAGGYQMELIGQPNTLYIVTYRDANGSIVTYSPVTDANGVHTEKITDSRRIDRIENGFINVMTYGNVVNSGTNCSYTSNATGWMTGSDFIVPVTNDPAYAVSNVRFGTTGGGISLLFDEPQNVTGDLTYDLFVVEAESGRRYGQGGSESDKGMSFFLGSYDQGVYQDMVIYTYENGEIKSWVELDGYCLSLVYDGESDARADFVFVGDSTNKAYECTVTGTPGKQFAIEMRAGGGSTNHFGEMDADGKWISVEGGEFTVSRIEDGYCMVREYDLLNISDAGSKCDVIYRDSKKWQCLPGYGYVTADTETTMNDKGDLVDHITFWDGEEKNTIQAKHQFTDVLAKGDFFSYRLEIKDDGSYRLAEIEKNIGTNAAVTGVKFGSEDYPDWISLDGVKYTCAVNCVIVYVDTEECEGLVDEMIELGQSVRYVLSEAGEIAVLFVDVSSNM